LPLQGGTMLNYIKYFLFSLLALVLSGCTGNGATVGDPLGTDSVTVIASDISLAAGQTSRIEATVKRDNGRAATDRTVYFEIVTNNSGGTLSVAEVQCDGQSKASATYTAGSVSPGSTVHDAVRVRLSNGSSDAVDITRTAGAGSGSAAPLVSLLTASQITLNAGQISNITANITDSQGNPVSGQTVSFSIPVKNSGSPTLTAASGVTDSAGNAITIYSPGIASPTVSVSDAVQASLANGSARAVIITRSGGTGAAGSVLSQLTASPNPVNLGRISTITALITNSSGTPVSGETVTFSIPIASSGSGSPTLIPAAGTPLTTDGNGNVVTIFSPGAAFPTSIVDDAVFATLSNGASRAVIVTRSGQTAAANTIALSASPDNKPNPGDSRVITALVTNAAGNPVSGITVTFTILIDSSIGAHFSSIPNVVTGADGKANIIYTAGVTATKTDAIGASIPGSDAAIVILVQ
jgi:hypothetical protein